MPCVPSDMEELSSGGAQMPADSAAFVDAVHARVNLVEAWERQVRSKDEKVVQRALENLNGMKYERGGTSREAPREYTIDVSQRMQRSN